LKDLTLCTQNERLMQFPFENWIQELGILESESSRCNKLDTLNTNYLTSTLHVEASETERVK
jgi:hypothetical protein